MSFIVYALKGQVHVFAGRVKIVSHSTCRTRAILKYFAPCLLTSSKHMITGHYKPASEKSVKWLFVGGDYNMLSWHTQFGAGQPLVILTHQIAAITQLKNDRCPLKRLKGLFALHCSSTGESTYYDLSGSFWPRVVSVWSILGGGYRISLCWRVVSTLGQSRESKEVESAGSLDALNTETRWESSDILFRYLHVSPCGSIEPSLYKTLNVQNILCEM